MWKLKIDENGNVVMQDGKPVYVDDKGKEHAYDVNESSATITRLNGENRDLRTRAETAEATTKKFEGIDPAQAKKDRETVAGLGDKDRKSAEEIETIKTEAVKAVHEQYKPVVEERDKLKIELHDERLGNAFNGSQFIDEKVSIPADMVKARFGTQFKDEDGKLVGYDMAGNKIFSRKPGREGTVADFDEALEIMIEGYAYKGDILKGTGNSGTGSRPGAEGGGANNPWKQGPTFSLTEQDKLEAKEPARAARLKAEAGVAA
jgi:hypothetical protein